MDIGLFMNTHGLGLREGDEWYLQTVPAEDMRPVEIARQAERLGFHSLWFSDHVLMNQAAASAHPANISGRNVYPDRPNMLDGAVVMGAVVAHTSRIKVAPSVLIAPYRHPLSDARQFATIDVLSNGRLIMGVGAGWLKEEFDALGLPYKDRGAMAEECIEVYKRAWTDPWVEFHGRFYDFQGVSMDPKPVQKPHPPIVFGSVLPVGARRAARLCDGLYPIFVDTYADPARYNNLREEVKREAERIGRDLTNFRMMAVVGVLPTDATHRLANTQPRPLCTGTAEQILSDLQRFADNGYSHCTVHVEAPSGTVDEWIGLVERFGKEVLPQAKDIRAAAIA